jgi:hypothetical protein
MARRPTTLSAVADQSETMTEFGLNFTDWLHEVRRLSSRPQLESTYVDEPRKLEGRFPDGKVADAWLAAYAEYLAARIGRPPPGWAFDEARISDTPWFSDILGSASLRLGALARSPLAFKRRNLYTYSVELPLRLHRGRPTKSEEHRRKSNSERQRRFRIRRDRELRKLRELVSAQGHFAPRA